jgi:hypothetical protein
MISWGDVSAIAPELATLEARAQEMILGIVDAQVDASTWGELADIGRVYLAAHLATISRRAGAGGPVTAEKLGPMAQSYGFSGGTVRSFDSTGYGMEYERLTRLLPRAIGVVA